MGLQSWPADGQPECLPGLVGVGLASMGLVRNGLASMGGEAMKSDERR